MSVNTTVLYPKLEGDDFFNMEYYKTKHMDMVKAAWPAFGLKSWQVLQFGPSADGTPGPYHAGVSLTWESAEAAKSAMASAEAKPIVADTPNFTNTKPILLFGSVVSSSD